MGQYNGSLEPQLPILQIYGKLDQELAPEWLYLESGPDQELGPWVRMDN